MENSNPACGDAGGEIKLDLIINREFNLSKIRSGDREISFRYIS